MRAISALLLARPLLLLARMAIDRSESWTIPFHILIWTVLSVGFIMVLVVLLMN